MDLEKEKSRYPGIDFEERQKAFLSQFGLTVILSAGPKGLETKVLGLIGKIATQSFKKEEGNFLSYLRYSRFINTCKSGTTYVIETGENEVHTLKTGETDFRSRLTSLGFMALATQRLHNIDRITINLLWTRVTDNVMAIGREELGLMPEPEPVPFVSKRRIKVKEQTDE